MATYSFNTTGSRTFLVADISASQSTTWNIIQSAPGASYFTLETIPDNNGFYTTSSVKGCLGSFTISSGIINLVKDDYKMSAVVAQGGGQITFVPSQYVSSSQMYVKGVG